jgi:hypothetical protein
VIGMLIIRRQPNATEDYRAKPRSPVGARAGPQRTLEGNVAAIASKAAAEIVMRIMAVI